MTHTPTLPLGYALLGTGTFERRPVAKHRETSALAIYVGGRWQAVAPVVEVGEGHVTVACPSCPPPRRSRRRKRPPTLAQASATHRHGRPPGERGPLLDRAPHHDGPEYAVVDVFGLLAH